MQQSKFNQFITEHKVERIEPAEFSGHILYFDNGDWIEVGSVYDGVVYRYHYPGEVLPDNKQLFNDLLRISPDYIENMKNKYQ